MRRLLGMCAIVAALAFAVDAFGQVSEYYLQRAESGHLWVIQEGEVVREWNIANGPLEIALTVTDMVRTYGYRNGDVGSEYELDGTPTGTTYPWSSECGVVYLDGATDGEYAYGIQYTSPRHICRYDMDWTNPELLFNLPNESWDAITYDPGDDTMWVTGRNRVLAQFEMDGTEVQRFTIPAGSRAAGLALDPADDTFWMYRGGDIIQQYSKDGELLTTHNVGGVSGNIWGGEFKFGRGGGPCDPCDANCDGSVDLTDVEPFIALMLGKDKPCDFCSGDTNDDGSVDLTDVEGFLECLLG